MGKKQTNKKIDRWGKWMDGMKQINMKKWINRRNWINGRKGNGQMGDNR